MLLWTKNKYENQVDVIVLEVGLGGRLDAVNLLDSDISVITSYQEIILKSSVIA